MNHRNPTLLAGLLLTTLVAGTALSQTTVLNDNCNATINGTGFALGEGVNAGINPPVTRLTGTVAANLRYIYTQPLGGNHKDLTAYDLGTSKYIRVSKASDSGRFSLSADGTTIYDFSSVLGSRYASPTNRAEYDISVRMRNDATGTPKFSLALATADGNTDIWDFGVQVWRGSSTATAYNIQKRVDQGSYNGAATGNNVGDINSTFTTAGTPGSFLDILIRVSDAGAESGEEYHSRLQISFDGGTNFVYDTDADTDLFNRWRFDGAARYIIFDQAGNTSGNVFYDDFSIVSNYAPTAPPGHVWTGGGTDNNWTTAGNWDGGGPVNGEPLIFRGITRQANNNDYTDLSVSSLTFSNGGFTLSGNTFTNTFSITNLAGANVLAGPMEWATIGIKSWSVAGGSELTLNNTVTVEYNGDHYFYGEGTLRQKGNFNVGQLGGVANPAFNVMEGLHVIDGGSFISRGSYRVGSLSTASGSAQTVLTNGALLYVTATGGNARVGNSASPFTSRLVIDHGTFKTDGALLCIPYASGATGEVAQLGGLVSCPISFCNQGTSEGSYTIKNGTLETPYIRETGSDGNSRIYFDNAVVRNYTATTNFMKGLDTAEIQAGGLTIDAQADMEIAQDLAGAGSLIKSNWAALTLTGTNTYLGSTVVQGGRLVVPTGRSYAGSIQIGDYTELQVVVQEAGSSLVSGGLALGSGNLSTLSFDLGSSSNPTVPLMTVTSLSANGVVSVNVANGALLTTGQFALVDYSGTIGGLGFGGFVIANLPSGVSAVLVNNSANSSLDLKITAVPGLRWTGAGGSSWDYGAASWYNEQTASSSTYTDGQPTWFVNGAATGNIDLSITPFPAMMVVENSSLAYRFSGAGNIYTPLLRKDGSGSLTLATDYINPITTLELNDGSVVLDHPYEGSFTTILSGDSAGQGSLVKSNAATLSLDGNNSAFNGTIAVAQGILKAGTVNALGMTNGPTVVADGATLDVNNLNLGVEPVFVSGAGVNGAGAIIDSTSGTGVQRALQNITLLGDTTIGGPGRWDIKAAADTDPGVAGNGYKLTKVGANWTAIAGDNGAVWNTDLGDIEIREGALSFETGANMGRAGSNLVVFPGAMLTLFNTGVENVQSKNLFMTNAVMRLSGPTAGGGAGTFGGVITLSGSNRFEVLNGVVHSLTNEIRGASDFVKTSTDDSGGTLILGVSNSYSGLTVVESSSSGSVGYSGKLRIQNAHGLGTTDAGTLVGVGGSVELEGPFGAPVYEPLQLGGAGGSGSPGALRNVAGDNTYAGPITISNPGSSTRIANGAADTLLTLDVPSGNAITALGDSNNLIFSASGSVAVNDPIVMGNGTVQSLLAGTLFLNSTVDAPVSVNKGALGGTGTINNNVFLSGGALAPGASIGTLTINGDLWMTNAAEFEIDKSNPATNDLVVVSGALNVDGTLTVTNLGPALAAGDVFKLFSKPAAGAFTATALPILPAGLMWTNLLAVDGTLRVVAGGSSPQFNAAFISDGNLVLTGIGGAEGTDYYLLSATNADAPLPAWAPVLTNQFGPGGQFSNAIPVNPGEPRRFYRVMTP